MQLEITVKQSKPDSEKQISNVFFHMWNLNLKLCISKYYTFAGHKARKRIMRGRKGSEGGGN